MKVFTDITMTLDGYVAGPEISVEHPLGRNGTKMHGWVYPLAGRLHRRSQRR